MPAPKKVLKRWWKLSLANLFGTDSPKPDRSGESARDAEISTARKGPEQIIDIAAVVIFGTLAASLLPRILRRRVQPEQPSADAPNPPAAKPTATAPLESTIATDLLPICFFDAEGRVFKGNEAFLQLTEYSSEELQAGNISRSSLCPADRVADCIRLHQTLDHGARAAWSETELLTKSGRHVPIIIAGALISGEQRGSVWVFIDVSGFRRTNAALWRRAEIERHLAMLSASLISIPFEEIDEAIEEGLSGFGRIFGAHGCATFLFEPETRQLHKCYEWRAPEFDTGEEIQLPGAVLHAFERLRAGECIHSYKIPLAAGGSSAGSQEMLCEIAVPLLSGGNLAGVLIIQCSRDQSAETDEGMTLLRLLAQIIANGVERMCANEALSRSEQTRDAVWQASLDAIVVMDASGLVMDCNPAAERIFGFRTQELIGASFEEHIIPAEFQPTFENSFQQLLASGTAPGAGIRSEIIALRKGGTRFPCELSMIPMTLAGNTLYIATARDITSRRLAEERLNASQVALQRAAEQTRAVLDSLPARVALFSGDGSVLATNRAWAEGPLPEWARPGNAIDPAGPSPVLARIMDVASGKDLGFSVEYASRGEDQSKRWSRVAISALGPHCRGAVVMHLDITEHQLAIEALADSEERYRSVVQNVREAIFSLSPRGHLLRVNPAVTSITGYPADSLLGRHFSQFVFPDDAPVLRNVYKSISAGEEPGAFTFRVRHANGRMLDLEFTVTLQYGDRGIVEVVGVARDVTERNKIQEQVRRLERLQSLGQLAAGVAQDFNNIITIQQGFASELSELQNLPKDAQKAVKEITAAGERAALLTEKLLTLGGRHSMQPKLLDVVGFITDMSQRIEQLLGEDVACTMQTVPHLPRVYLDPKMLEQLIANIVSNSHDAMPDGGAIVISLDDLEISEATAARNPETHAGHFVRITITDSGCGISPENLQHIFEPFFTTKHVARGAGLGLATAHGIVKQNGGWIEVESRLHSGTSVCIYLPVATQDSLPENATSPVNDMRTILVVEDETQLCHIVARDLQKRGYKVLTATSGAEALKLWSEHGGNVDLLLTDLMMPEGMNGRELAENLLRVRPDLKVLYTSGYSTEILGEGLALQPGRNFIPKPYQPHTLADAVKDCLGLY